MEEDAGALCVPHLLPLSPQGRMQGFGGVGLWDAGGVRCREFCFTSLGENLSFVIVCGGAWGADNALEEEG